MFFTGLAVLRQGQARSAPDGIGGRGVTGSEALMKKCITVFTLQLCDQDLPVLQFEIQERSVK